MDYEVTQLLTSTLLDSGSEEFCDEMWFKDKGGGEIIQIKLLYAVVVHVLPNYNAATRSTIFMLHSII